MQIDPVPDAKALARFYREDYRRDGFNASADPEVFPWDCRNRLSRGRALRRLVERHGRLPEQARILEIGAGFGHNLAAFREARPQALLVASEADPSCRPTLLTLGAARIEGDWSGADARRAIAAHGPFDVVLLVHVLEHPADPDALIRSVREVLARGGLLVLEVPNEWEREVRTNNNAPHICFFERASLGAFLQRRGGTLRTLETCGPAVAPPGALWKRAILATVPAGLLRRAYRHAMAPPVRHPVTPDERADPERVPIPSYDEYGGDRLWLRAVVSF
jgi:SAM-dependent methyltransferase